MIRKDFLLTFIFLLIAVRSHAVDMPFADEQLKKCIQEAMEKQQWHTLDQITNLQCHSKEITSLAGIDHLPKLQKLSLYNNNLAKVHVPHLPELRHLNLAKNHIADITFADLPALSELYLFNNRLEKFQLPPLPALKLIKINDNRLLTFTYDTVPALEKIYMFNNLMEHVDIYRLPALKYMDARQNPMPDPLYEEMDKMPGVTFLHDGNAEDWQ